MDKIFNILSCKMMPLKIWINSAAGKLSIFLGIIGLFILFLAYSDYEAIIKNKAEFINNVLIGFGTGIFCIVITISFVQYFIDQNKKINDKNKELEDIIRYNLILSNIINRFLLYVGMVVAPESLIKNCLDSKQINLNFNLQDMTGLFTPSLIVTDSFFTPAVDLLLDAESDLRNYIIKEIQNINFDYYPNIRSIFLQLVVASLSFEGRGAILATKNCRVGDKKATDEVSELIAKYGEDYFIKFNKGELKSNVLIPYIFLYFLLKEELNLLNKYCDIIASIDADARNLIRYTFNVSKH